MNKRSRKTEYVVLIGVLLIFGFSLLFSLNRLHKVDAIMATELKLGTWLVSQAEVEYLRLLNAFKDFGLEESALTRDELIERFEIFWSRLPLLLHGSESESLRHIEGFAQTVSEVIESLEAMEPSLVDLTKDDRQGYEFLREQLQNLAAPLHKLSVDSNVQTRWDTGLWGLRGKVVRWQIAVSFLGMLASGGVLVFLLLRERSKSRELLDNVEAAEARFKQFTEIASDWQWEMDKDFRFSFISQRVREVIGVEPAWFLGKTRWEVAGVEPVEDKWRQHVADLEAHRAFRDFRLAFVGPDDECRHARVNGKPMFDQQGTFTGYRGTATDETTEVQARQRADKAEAQLRESLESISEGFALYDSSDRLVLCNNEYERLYAGESELRRGETRFTELLKLGLLRGQYADALGREEAWLDERLREYREPQAPMEQKLSDGRWLLIEHRCLPDGGRVCVSADITQLKVREQSLRESESTLRAVIEGISEGVYVKDTAGRYTIVNSTGARFVGRPLPEMVGKTAGELFPTHLAGPLSEADQHVLSTGHTTTIEHDITLQGEKISLLSTKSVFRNEDNEVLGLVCVSRDITERKRTKHGSITWRIMTR